ncbi:MAG: hypothetical protein LM517_11340 [Nitrosomonas sp.]|nr:hypothetical protein [Nitrosomonas sp.]
MKNTVQVNMLMGLVNLCLLRRDCWLLEEQFAQDASTAQTMKHKREKSGGKTLPKNELPEFIFKKTDSNT